MAENEKTENPNPEQWKKLVPFARRAGVALTGREKLAKLGARVAFVLITEDISENSRNEARSLFSCPIYQTLTSAEVDQLFGLKDSKLIGFKKSEIAAAIEKFLGKYRLE